jgi:hypothetical protein
MQAVRTNVRTILLLVMLALPSTASATTVEVLKSNGTHFSSPVLAGDSVVVTSFPPNHTSDLLAVTPGTPARRLLHITDEYSSPIAAASGDTVLARVDGESGASDLYRGPVAGPLAKIESCPQSANLSFPTTPAIDGDLAAWSAAGCARDRIHMELGPISRTVDATGYVAALAAAGRYVAWLSNEPAVRLTVYDVQAGQTAYTAIIGGTNRLDVQADGAVVLTQLDLQGNGAACHGPPRRLTYFTVAEPVAHTVPVSTCFDNPRIAAGRIAFAEHLANGGERLAITNLAGTQIQPVARIDAKPTPYPDFDYDGARIVWSQVRCRDEVILRRDASDTSAEDPPVTCPVRVGRPILRRDGTLHVAVSCPNGCRPAPGASLQGMQIISPHWLHLRSKDRHGNPRYSPFVRFDLQAGKRTVVRLPLTSHQRTLLRRRHSVSIRLKVLLQNVYLPRLVRIAHA